MRVDSEFFKVFDFPFVSGDKKTALRNMHAILLTETTAKKYFGDEDPINKIIRINLNDGTDFIVAGVLKDIPQNSHFTFDVVIPFESRTNPDANWSFSSFYTYARLKDGSDAKRFESGVKSIYRKNNPNSMDSYYIQPLTDIHLKSNLKWELGANGNMLTVKIMIAIALFVLIIAAINYVNLFTARAGRRAKEVGVRKVTGARRIQVVNQFLVESIFTAIISLGLSIILTSLFLPYAQDLLDYDLSSVVTRSGSIKIIMPCITLLIGIIAGLYPALYLSSFDPARVLKFRFSGQHHGIQLRHGLVVFQFVISTGLIIGSLIIVSQLTYLRQKNLGFDKENILLLPNVRGGVGNGNHPGNMIHDIKSIPGVQRIARADGILGDNNSVNGVSSADQRTHIVLNFVRADYDFIPALNIQLKEGRNFSEDFPSDSTGIILNETAITQLGLRPPYIGQQINWDDQAGATHHVNIIGITKDFHFGSLREAIKPFGFILEVNNGSTFFLKLQSSDLNRTLAAIKAVWTRHYPERPFEYSFQNEEFEKLYVSEGRFEKLFSMFTILGLFIACLGMFGLVTYLAESKTKEIGIRKVLGASVSGIVFLLSKDFLKMVVIALAISGPFAWYLMHHWLLGFAYRVSIDWQVFALTGIVSVVIALITVSHRSIKAARANPVTSLRSE